MKNIVFLGLVSFLIYSCIPEDKFILPEPVNQTLSNRDTLNQQNDTPSSTISGGGSGSTSDTSSSNQNEIIQNATLLNTYANVKAQVDNGKFLGTIQHSQGYIPMPSADTKLDPCTIEKIKTWINDGAPNN